MRASFWVIGPLLARMGEAKVSLPGGCAIGTRPVDLFIEALQDAGRRHRDRPRLRAGPRQERPARRARRLPQGHRRRDPRHDDGGGARQGETVIENAAREPEIVDLAECLTKMGARISGAGTSTIHIEGVDRLGARPPSR